MLLPCLRKKIPLLMTFHFAAILPDRGIGILSDSVVSFQRGDGSWAFLDSSPKSFVINQNAAIACAGHGVLCLEIVSFVARHASPEANFAEIAPLIQRAYIAHAKEYNHDGVELLLAAKTANGGRKMRLIKFAMKASGKALLRLEPCDRHHYTAGLQLPLLEQELCRVLTVNYKHTFGIEKKMGNLLEVSKHVFPSPKSLPLGICIGSLSSTVAEYVRQFSLQSVVGSPWTALLMPEDGPIHFIDTEMYDGEKTVQPFAILPTKQRPGPG